MFGTFVGLLLLPMLFFVCYNYTRCFSLAPKDVDGVSHRGEPGTPSDKTLPSNLLTLMAFISFHVPTNLSWKAISGSTIGKSLPFSLPPTIVTDVEIKPQLWRSTILWIRLRRTLFTIIANFHNSTQHRETKIGTRVPERLITFCKSKIM